MKQSATDPQTGEINMDIITTGRTKGAEDRIKKIKDNIIIIFVSSLISYTIEWLQAESHEARSELHESLWRPQ